jgi:hypothetical protein
MKLLLQKNAQQVKTEDRSASKYVLLKAIGDELGIRPVHPCSSMLYKMKMELPSLGFDKSANL